MKGRIPINLHVDLNNDPQSLALANETMVNGVYLWQKREQRFVCRQRPGLTEFVSLGTSAKIDGKFEWISKGWVVAVSDGSVFKITDNIGSFTDITGAGTMNAGTPVTFALVKEVATGTEYLFMASGGQIAYTDGTTGTQYIADPTAPTNCTHIRTLDQTLIANDTQNDNIYNSDPGDPFTWSALSFVSAEATVDKVNAIEIVERDILLFGTRSIEPFWSTGGTPQFERRSDALKYNTGTDSPYSIAQEDEVVYFIDNKREIQAIKGLQETPISEDIRTEINGLSSVSDAIGQISKVGGLRFYVIKFPTDGRTFMYSIDYNYWTEIKSWDDELSTYKEYIGDTHLYVQSWNFHLVGDTTTDKIYKASYDTYQDEGITMRLLKKTGHWDAGDEVARKFSKLAIFRIKSGVGERGTNPRLNIRVNVDNMGFGKERYIELGDKGDKRFHHRFSSGGIFRTKQYEFVWSENAPLFLIEGYEEYDILEN